MHKVTKWCDCLHHQTARHHVRSLACVVARYYAHAYNFLAHALSLAAIYSCRGLCKLSSRNGLVYLSAISPVVCLDNVCVVKSL